MPAKANQTRRKGITKTIEIPEGVGVSFDKDFVVVKGPKGENRKKLYNKKVSIKIDNSQLNIFSGKSTKKEKKTIGTFRAHIRNMIRGVIEPHKYVLKICSGHFPMNVSISNNKFIVKNLLGEKIPRVMDIQEGVAVRVEGDNVIVESVDKEKAGQCAASIEHLTKRTGYDSRVFQDGIWLTSKGGKEIK